MVEKCPPNVCVKVLTRKHTQSRVVLTEDRQEKLLVFTLDSSSESEEGEAAKGRREICLSLHRS